MPTYEYACRQCGEHLEVVQSFTDDPLSECPHCGGALRKVFGSVGIVFKGSGFYKTDSRSASAPKAKDAEKGEKTDKPAVDSSPSSAAATPSESGAKPSSSETKAPAAAS